MDDVRLGRTVRALRQKRNWRQVDLAHRAELSAALVGLLERGHADRLTVRAVRQVAQVLGLQLRWDAGYRGAELGRLLDADHARLAEWLVRRLDAIGWTVAVEASYNHFGERGRIDILAYHALTRTLLVVEIKTLIVEVQDLLGGLSTKARIAPIVARSLGFRPASVVPCLVLLETTTNRRRLSAHERLFARLAVRGRLALSWLAASSGAPDGLLLFVKLPDHHGIGARRAGRQRVRLNGVSATVFEHDRSTTSATSAA
jgi:transcriptional regulator with XRE-family HTH domain